MDCSARRRRRRWRRRRRRRRRRRMIQSYGRAPTINSGNN
jgi:hypothetical protein